MSILQTDLPRLSAAVQHKEKDGIGTTWGQGEEKHPSQLKDCQHFTLIHHLKVQACVSNCLFKHHRTKKNLKLKQCTNMFCFEAIRVVSHRVSDDTYRDVHSCMFY